MEQLLRDKAVHIVLPPEVTFAHAHSGERNCMCVYIYTHTHIYIYIYIYTWMDRQIDIHVLHNSNPLSTNSHFFQMNFHFPMFIVYNIQYFVGEKHFFLYQGGQICKKISDMYIGMRSIAI